jgi:hypothetical protein
MKRSHLQKRVCKFTPKKFYEIDPSVLYCKKITIVNDTFRVVRSEAPSCVITYDHHSGNYRGIKYAPKEHL